MQNAHSPPLRFSSSGRCFFAAISFSCRVENCIAETAFGGTNHDHSTALRARPPRLVARSPRGPRACVRARMLSSQFCRRGGRGFGAEGRGRLCRPRGFPGILPDVRHDHDLAAGRTLGLLPGAGIRRGQVLAARWTTHSNEHNGLLPKSRVAATRSQFGSESATTIRLPIPFRTPVWKQVSPFAPRKTRLSDAECNL